MKKLIIVLFIIGGLLVLRPIDAFVESALANIVHRRNLVTGIITADNGNKSYAVEIGESGKSIPAIFTLSPNPDLAVGDKVRVFCRGGNSEDLILLAPTKSIPSIVRRYALIIASPNELKVFDMEGVVLYLLATGGWAYSGCDITMDSDGNAYTETNWVTLKKYDNEGNLLVTHEIESGSNWFESMNIGPDGYLYTLEGRALGYAIAKRNVTDLTVIEDVVTLTTGSYGGGICLDSNGNFYIYNWREDKIEKWSSAGILLISLDVGYISEYAGFGVCGSNVYIGRSTRKIYYMPLDLSSYTEWNLPSSEAYALTVADGKLILSGWDGDGDGATTQYDSDRNLILQVKLGAGYAYKAGGYNF